MLKLVLSASVVVVVAITALAASAPTPAAPAPAVQAQKADPTKDLYASNCQQCHGPEGRTPVKDMSFVGRQWKTKTAAEAVKMITKGSPGTAMLPFEGKLTKPQIAALARYVRGLDTPAARKKK